MSFLISLRCSVCGHEHTTEWAHVEHVASVQCDGCGRALPIMVTPELTAELGRRHRASLKLLRESMRDGDADDD